MIIEKQFFGKYKIENIKEALNNKDREIRLEAYRILEFIEKALIDKDKIIRLEVYRRLGFPEKAFNNDPVKHIRLEKEEYFEIKNVLKELEKGDKNDN